MKTPDGILIGLFFLGTMIGSFLNVIIYRLPNRISLWSPRSHCPDCKSPLRWYHNVPLWSYLMLKGQCAYCNHKISARYFIVEFLSGLVLMLMYIHFGFSLYFFKYSFLLFCMIVLSFIDYAHRIVPDRLIIILGLAGFGFSIAGGEEAIIHSFIGFGGGLIGMIGIWALGKIIFRKDGIGGGDIKLVAILGIYLVWYKLIIAVFLSFIILSLFGWGGILLKKITRYTPIPMVPFLSLGLLGTIYFGYIIWHWYMHFIF